MSNNTQFWKSIDPTGRQLRPFEVCELTGLSKAQIYNLIKDGSFPPFLKIGKRASAMPKAWLDAYLINKAAEALL